jgi:hypothetical protein
MSPGDVSTGGPGDASTVDLGSGVKRVTLRGNYAESLQGQGWNFASGRIAVSSADADFELAMTMVISLFPSKPGVGFCKKSPPPGAARFMRVEEISGDAASCENWEPAYLGGNSPLIAESIAGQGFLVRDRNSRPVARLLTVSGSIVAADVVVTFDIVTP